MVSARLYDKWKADIESEYAPQIQKLQRQLRELEEQRARDLAALDKFWPKLGSEEQLSLTSNESGEESSLQGGDGGPLKVNGSRGMAVKHYVVPRTRSRSVKENVRDIVSELGDEIEITQGEVRDRYLQIHPDVDSKKVRPSISHALRQLMEEGELERVSEGVASEPHRYRKTTRREQSVSE
jgi:hypothetical protein